MTSVLLTCPPMILQRQAFQARFLELGWQVDVPEFEQTVSEDRLVDMLPGYDAWIIGDDPASRRVVQAGVQGRFRAAVKWGVGTDNVAFDAFEEFGVPVAHTPGMFGAEVADVALGYVVALARHTFEIDRGIRQGRWPKPTGISLAGRRVALIGFGDIGRNTARRLAACDLRVIVYDPKADVEQIREGGYELACWPDGLESADFLVFTCALTPENRHMLDAEALSRCKPGVRIVNVARGPLIDQEALVEAQSQGHVSACALDVFEAEPLPPDDPLRQFDTNVFGSHNGSNTIDGVHRTSLRAIELLSGML